jgi:predicted RNA binding protein YcfA (HicA-like mRNA interferase family)
MPRLPAVNPEDCIKALEKAGFEASRQKGSHLQMRRNEPQPARTIPVPMSKKPLPRGTLRSIIRQSGMTVEEFVALLES